MSQNMLALPDRLKNGAKKLGEIWKTAAERCSSGWSLDPCTCQPQKKFCQGRTLWLTLAVEAGRDLEDGPFGMALAMSAEEWDSTGLTMAIEHPEIGKLLLGGSQTSVTGMVDMQKMMDAPDVLASTLRVLRAFPKSKVEGMEDTAAVPAAVVEANPDEAFE